jgi:hypothetical protein
MKTAAKTGKSTERKKTSGNAETGECMSWKDIERMYPDQWILLGDPVFAKKYAPMPEKGILLCASKNEDDLSEVIKKSKNSFLAVRYTGKMPRCLHLL